jgi:hypothetical protein
LEVADAKKRHYFVENHFPPQVHFPLRLVPRLMKPVCRNQISPCLVFAVPTYLVLEAFPALLVARRGGVAWGVHGLDQHVG